MVAAARRIYLRRATEFAHVRNERIPKQTAAVEVLDERGVGLVVHRADNVLHALDARKRLRAVDIPSDLIEHGEERVDGHKSHAALHQPSREEAALSEAVHAIAFAHGRRLFRQIERRTRLLAGHHPECRLEVIVEQPRVLAFLKRRRRAVYDLPHRFSAIQAGRADLIGRQKVRHFEVLHRRVGHE